MPEVFFFNLKFPKSKTKTLFLCGNKDQFRIMKYLIIALMFPVICISQKRKEKIIDTSHYAIFPEINGDVIYSDVIIVDSGFKKDDLYIRARSWFVDEYKSSKDVIQMEDKEAGQIIGKGLIKIDFISGKGFMTSATPVTINHTITIFVKDGKFKYEIKNINSFYLYQSYISVTPLEYSFYLGNDRTTRYFAGIDRANINYERSYKYFLTQVNDRFKQIVSDLKVAMSKPIKSNDF